VLRAFARSIGPVIRIAFGLLLALGTCVPAFAGEVYRWVDENGVVHYRIERDERSGRQRVRLRPPGALAIPEPDAQEPSRPLPPEATSPAEPEVGTDPFAPGPAQVEQTPAPLARGGATTETQAEGTPTPLEDEAPVGDLIPPSEPPGPIEPRSWEEPPSDELPSDELPSDELPSERARQIAELEAQIARDRETLKGLISETPLHGQDVSSDPRVREIAERLPRLQSELQALRAEPEP
jgi:hypothetical protein